MSSRYQTSTVTSNYNSNSDNKLDELLEDLQSTVAQRPLVNGTSTYRDGSTGYREVFKSVQSQSTGQPAQSSKEYQFEYLNPSNSVSVVPERPKSPFYDKENIDSVPGKNVSSYKTVSYHYNTKKTGNQVIPAYETKQTEKSEAKFRQNINELDSLLDDLNHTQKVDFSSNQSSNRLKEYNSGFIEPLGASTPHKKSHVSRIEERTFEEQRYGTNGNSPPVRSHEVKKEVYYNGEPVERYHNKEFSGADSSKDLLYTSGSLRNREPSPARQLQEVYHYETRSSSRKTDASPQRSLTRNYNYESDVTDNAVPFTYDYNRSPSPARSIHNYSSSTIKESTTHRSPSPARSYYSTTSTVRNVTPQPITKSIYSASKTIHETNRRETQRSPSTPPPHRSPSPVSFAQPPDPPMETSVKSYNFERNIRPQSPTLKQKFSPSDPSRDAVPGHTVITRNYKYSSQSTQRSKYPPDDYKPEPSPSYHRPFPTPSPPPEIREQKPPKHIDELMASFSDTEHRSEVFNRYNVSRSSSKRCPTPAPEKLQTKKPPSPPSTPTEKTIPIETQKLHEVRKDKTNGVAGPPVYYPPGPLFSKKEETAVMHQCEANGKGKMSASRKAKYKYEAGSKYREDSDVKKTLVPVCCPVCCALPCAIM